MKKIKLILLAIVTTTILSGCSVSDNIFHSNETKNSLIISEVVSSDSASINDPELGHPDWVELCNVSASQIELSGYSIGVKKKEGLESYDLPDIKLNPNQYIVLYCCSAPEKQENGKYCTGFKLSKSGVTLFLSDSNTLVQELEVPALDSDISYGIDASVTYKFFSVPTPGAPNNTKAYDTLADLENSGDSLKINEVMPKCNGDANAYPWVEIYNSGQTAADMSSLCISDSNSNPTKAHFPDDKIAPGGYAVFKFTGNKTQGEIPFKLGETKTTLIMSASSGMKIDTISWNAGVFPGISVGYGDRGTTVYMKTPTPGVTNSTNYLNDTDFTLKDGTPAIRINEILLKNTFSLVDESGDRSPWVELYNTSNAPVSLSGYALSDNNQNIWKWSFPDITMAPGSYQTVFLSGKDIRTSTELDTNFKLGNTDSCLVLTDMNTKTEQTVDIPTGQQDNTSYGIGSNGQWQYFTQPTPGAKNSTESFPEASQTKGTGIHSLRINEASAAKPVKSRAHDWVEIYNVSTSSVEMKGYYLSDTSKDLKKWPIPDKAISANGYAVISRYGGSSPGYINMSPKGTTLYLTDSEGDLVDKYDTGMMRPNESTGLITVNGKTERAVFTTPTPGAANTGRGNQGYCEPPVFSVPGGHQNTSINLQITTTTPGGVIYYTLDGSTPTNNSKQYKGPIEVSTNETVRAIVYSTNKLPSDETVATYLFDSGHTLPVVCLSMSKSDLNYVFSSRTRKEKYYREGYVEYYEGDGKLGVSFPADFRLAGNGTRQYAQKSIDLYLRGAYGRGSVTYPFFSGTDITDFKSFTLRNSGEDDSITRIKDAYFGNAVNGMNIENMQTNFCVVYINGQYWGLYEFKENQNKSLFASEHGIDPDLVTEVRQNVQTYRGNSQYIKNLYQVARSVIANNSNFDKYAQLVDVNYFTDYLIADTYFLNTDFYNEKYVCTADFKMKWRPLFFDYDYGFRGENPHINILSNIFLPYYQASAKFNSGDMNNTLFRAFYSNPQWRSQFVQRYAQVLNTTLTKDKMLSLFDKTVNEVKGEMPRTIQRWHKPISMAKWEREIARMRQCIIDRRGYAINELQSFFHLSDSEIKQLFPNG